MPTRVMVRAEPLITPADVPGAHALDDATVAAMIAAATAAIDGPTGWIGRSFGPQTLQTSFPCWTDVAILPFGPVIDVVSVSYTDASGVEVDVDDANWTQDGDYLYFSTGWGPALGSRAYPIKVEYEAGYDDEAPASGGTGPLPGGVTAALIEGVQQMILARSDSLRVRSVTTDDIETINYLDADKVSGIMRRAAGGLLAGLWVPTL